MAEREIKFGPASESIISINAVQLRKQQSSRKSKEEEQTRSVCLNVRVNKVGVFKSGHRIPPLPCSCALRVSRLPL